MSCLICDFLEADEICICITYDFQNAIDSLLSDVFKPDVVGQDADCRLSIRARSLELGLLGLSKRVASPFKPLDSAQGKRILHVCRYMRHQE